MGSQPINAYTQYSTIFGVESYPSSTVGLARVISGERVPMPIAVPTPAYLFNPRMRIARFREYRPPEDVDHLDARFSQEEYGSELYKRAKDTLFDMRAIMPGASRKVRLEDGSVVNVHDYRPWLSHWLIRGLADLSQSDGRLRQAGIVPGEDLESRLVYRGGMDFSGAQYSIMTTVMQELAEKAHAEQGTPQRKEGALHNYLTGKTTTPLLGDWELLEAFGTISKNIRAAAASKNREQFEKQEGFYWAVRMWDVWRSAYRIQRPVPSNDNRSAPKLDKWDHVPVAEGYRRLTEGVLESIDGDFDWVAIGHITNIQNGHELLQPSSAWNNRMFIYRANSDGRTPKVLIKLPHQLLMDYGALTDILSGLMTEFLRLKGQTIKPNGAKQILNPIETAIDHFYPRHLEILPAVTTYSTHNGTKHTGTNKHNRFANDSVKKCVEQRGLLISAIEDGSFEQQFGIPAGTIDYAIRVLKSVGSHIPGGLTEYITRFSQIEDLEDILNDGAINTNRTVEHQVKLASIGVQASNNKELKRAKQRLEELNRKYIQSYARNYGTDLLAFKPDSLDENQEFLRILSAYGLSDLQKYTPLASEGIKAIVETPPAKLETTFVLDDGAGKIKVTVRVV